MGRNELPGGGDRLARGQKSATFHVPSNYPSGQEAIAGTSGSLEVIDNPPKELLVTDHRRDYDLPIEPLPEPVCPIVTVTPMGQKVLLWRIPVREGLIVEADTAKEKPLDCIVVAVNPSEQVLKVGDKVKIRKFSGTEIELMGHEFTIIMTADVLLKL